jgi:hypothetical protein
VKEMLQHCIDGNIEKAYKVCQMHLAIETSPGDVTLPSGGIMQCKSLY